MRRRTAPSGTRQRPLARSRKNHSATSRVRTSSASAPQPRLRSRPRRAAIRGHRSPRRRRALGIVRENAAVNEGCSSVCEGGLEERGSRRCRHRRVDHPELVVLNESSVVSGLPEVDLPRCDVHRRDDEPGLALADPPAPENALQFSLELLLVVFRCGEPPRLRIQRLPGKMRGPRSR
jgi:hypothetical protein